MRNLLFMLVLLPLWASYLARVYAWIVILRRAARSTGRCRQLGPRQRQHRLQNTAMWLVFSYIWLPFMIIPVFGALERIPEQPARGRRRPRCAQRSDARARVRAAARAPGHRRGIDLHVRPDARRLHHADPHRRHQLELHRQRHLRQHRRRRQPAVRRDPRDRADRDHDGVPDRRAARSARSRRSDGRMARRRAALRLWVVGVLVFLFVPIAIVVLFAFDSSNVQSWPIAGLRPMVHGRVARPAGAVSVVAVGQGRPLRDGDRASSRLARRVRRAPSSSFFGREVISLLLVLPLALPGHHHRNRVAVAFTFAGDQSSL